MSPLERARQHFLTAMAALEQVDFSRAAAELRQAHQLAPERVSILINLAATLLRLNQAVEAETLSRLALSLELKNPQALLNLAQSLTQQQRNTEALACCDELLEQTPDNTDAQFNRGVILGKLGRHQEALASFDPLLAQDPDNHEIWLNRGAELRALGRLEEAISSTEHACKLAPTEAKVWLNLGNVQHDLHQDDAALASFKQACTLAPDMAEAWLGCSTALHGQLRFEDAIAASDKALQLHADNPIAWKNRAHTLYSMKCMREALTSFDHALSLDPQQALLPGIRLHVKLHCCDWEGLTQDFEKICAAIESEPPVSDPFCFLSLPASRMQQLRCAQRYAAHHMPHPQAALWQGETYRHERIRIGYFSSDFHEHATAWLMARLFELHDRSRFEIFAFSFGPDKQDSMRKRLVNAFEHFYDVRALSNAAIAAQARSLEIDIAIDLKGYTTDSRPGIFSHRPAPLQVNYLGYPGSMGVNFIDYLIADPFVLPSGTESSYNEKIVRLPHSYQVNDALREIATETPSRTALGLPEQAFVFCCFNNNYKITPDVFSIWMRLLTQVPGSVLWLLADNPDAVTSLRATANAAGIEPQRLIFAARASLPEHLARQRQADLFLDTFHYNAHTTASDALWAGLPVLTCAGQSFPARVAASLLNAIDLPQLITQTPTEYETQALQLARNPKKISSIRAELAAKIHSRPLFDSALFTQHIEDAFETMHLRHTQGMSPDHLTIPPHKITPVLD